MQYQILLVAHKRLKYVQWKNNHCTVKYKCKSMRVKG